MADRVIQRHDTIARWKSVNPVLAEGEIGIEIDGAKGYKIGDGVTAWNNLPYPANPANIVQEKGNNVNAAMSQDAATRELTELGNKLIELVGIGNDATVVGAKEGDYYFSTAFNHIRYKTSTSSEEVPFVKGALYSCNGTIYKWDFDNKVLFPFVQGILNVNTIDSQNYASFYTLEQAISAVPKSYRRSLQLIQYRTSASSYEYAQYLVSDTSDTYWLDKNYWRVILASDTAEFCKASGSLNLNAWKGMSTFYTLEQAISEVPYERRTTGFRLTFRLNLQRWQTAIFIVGDVSDQYWKDVNCWRIDNNIPVININDLLNTQTTYYTLREAIDLVPSEYRAGGAIITFRSDARMRKTYQYLLGTPDANWYEEENWLELYGDTNVAIKDFVFGGGSDLFMYRGYQIAKSDGSIQIADSEYYACTPFLPVKKGVEIIGCEGGNASRCSFYDEEYQFISSLIVEATSGNNVKTVLTDDNIPSNAIYFRATGSFIDSIPSVSGFDSYSSLKSAALANERASKAFARNVNWMALGDSITQGYYSNNIDPFYHLDPSKSYCKYIAELNGWTLNNEAIGGTGYICKGPRGTSTNGKELVQTLDFSNVDLVTIAYGVNDWKYNMALGSMEDSIDQDAIIPAMRYVIEKIIEKNPLTKIVVITPINCAVGGNESTNYGLGYSFSKNGTLEDIYNAFVEVCEYYGIEYIDMTHASIFNRKNLLSMLLDKVHPTIDALKVMGRELAAKISYK